MFSVLSTVTACLKLSNNAPPRSGNSRVSRAKRPAQGQRRQPSRRPADIETHFYGESPAIDTRQPSKRSRVTPRRQSGGELSPVTDVI